MAMSRRAVFLDRDGVINSYVHNAEFGTVDSPSTPEQFQLIPGVAEAIRKFHSMDLLVIVVSNQPGIAKGKFTRELLDDTTTKMLLACDQNIDDVFYCLHHPQASNSEYRSDCLCRKPKPGLLHEAARKWQIDLEASFMIGDGFSDILAGKAAGTSTILVGSRKCYVCEEARRQSARPDFFAVSLFAAADIVLKQQITRSSQGTCDYGLYSKLS